MIEWFKNLDVAWQTAIFGAIIAVAIAVVGAVFKLLFGRKSNLSVKRAEIHQEDFGNKAVVVGGNHSMANIAGRDIRTGVNEDVLKDALKALNTALAMVDTDQSKKLASEIKSISSKSSDIAIEPVTEKENESQKIHLEKEFQLYGELWKALVDVRSSIIITPTLDIMPEGKSPYDVYKERAEAAANAFNKANGLFEEHRPFFHGNVSSITKEFLSRCRHYIVEVNRSLCSRNFDDKLYDKADELLEVIPKAIDEIEKAIKRRIGLLRDAEVDVHDSIGPGLGSRVHITKGSITYKSNSLNLKPLSDIKMSITEGYLKRNDFGKLEAYIKADVPFQSLQRLNEKLGLNSMNLVSESNTLSTDNNKLTVFTSSTNHILPKGEMVLNILTWQEEPFPMTIHVQALTSASGFLNGKVFQGTFEATLIYQETNFKISSRGDFEAHLA